MKIQTSIQEYLYTGAASSPRFPTEPLSTPMQKTSDFDRTSFQHTGSLSVDETLYARSLARQITDEVSQEHQVSSERISSLKESIEQGTYQPEPMAIAKAMFAL